MRITLAIAFAAVFGILALTATPQQFPLKQDLEVLKQAPMHPEKVKEGSTSSGARPCRAWSGANLARPEMA